MGFTLEEPTSLYFETNLPAFELDFPTGNRHVFEGANRHTAWFNLPAGEFSITASASNTSLSVRAMLHSLERIPQIELPYVDFVAAGRVFQFDVPEASEYLLEVRNSLGSAYANFSIWNASGERLTRKPLMRLDRGRYWIVVHSVEDHTLHLAPVGVTKVSAEVGELRQLQTTPTNNALVQYTLNAGDLVDVPLHASDADVNIQFRFVPLGGTHDPTIGWSSLDLWTAPRHVQQDAHLEFLILGNGQSWLQLVDFRQAPALALDQLHQLTHLAGYQRSTWRFEVDDVGPYLYTNWLSQSAETEWWILNATGHRLLIPTHGTVYSFGRSGEYYLVSNKATPSETDLQFSLELSSL